LEGVEVEIVLVDDQTIWDLNRTYRGRDRPTDVLAFSMSEGEGADLTPSLLGEVYVNLDRAAIQAQEYDVPFHEEVARLVIHGLLHLVGYTHAAMVDKEDQFLTMWRA
jgi:probable rRNA maturation factor